MCGGCSENFKEQHKCKVDISPPKMPRSVSLLRPGLGEYQAHSDQRGDPGQYFLALSCVPLSSDKARIAGRRLASCWNQAGDPARAHTASWSLTERTLPDCDKG